MTEQKLLLVDDDENILKSLTRLFQDDAFEILTAHNGRDGLDIIKKNICKVVISDYRMPEMDGIEFLEQVRKVSPDTIRIILTGYTDVNIALAAINKGHVYKFMTKPWDDEFIRLMIRRSFEYYDLLQERQSLLQEILQKNSLLENINKNLEKIVEERTQQLLYSERMATLGQMAGHIGHEINNILTILKCRLDLAKKKINEDEVIQKTFDIFSHEFDRLEIHTKNLLTLGKPVPSEFKNVDIQDIAENTLKTLLETGMLKYYAIQREYQEELPAIFGDASQINQVLTNLLINAHHAMENKGMLTIRINYLADRRAIEVSIKDTGKGIPEEYREKIFEPFFTTKPEGKGTGLGLSVVKKIVTEHKGYISVMSKVTVGTTMTIGFPISVKNGQESRVRSQESEDGSEM